MGGVSQIRRERKYLGGWSREKVRSVAKLVEQLEGNPGWEALKELMQAQIEVAEQKLVSLKPLEQADYAMTAGIIRGFRGVTRAVEQLRDEAARIDGEDREAAERQTAAGGEA
jgi:hypothetical protein